jgi:hypothetical protein
MRPPRAAQQPAYASLALREISAARKGLWRTVWHFELSAAYRTVCGVLQLVRTQVYTVVYGTGSYGPRHTRPHVRYLIRYILYEVSRSNNEHRSSGVLLLLLGDRGRDRRSRRAGEAERDGSRVTNRNLTETSAMTDVTEWLASMHTDLRCTIRITSYSRQLGLLKSSCFVCALWSSALGNTLRYD